MQTPKAEEKVIIALDVASLDEARRVVELIGDQAVTYKIGFEFFTRCGPPAISLLRELGKEVFLDLKYHDIPNTVSKAVVAAAALDVKMLNVHASGGMAMMRAAAESAKATGGSRTPIVLAVTVLTSIDQAILEEEIGCSRPVEEQVAHFARLAAESGLDGVVASPKEIGIIRREVGPRFLIVTPGIRPLWAATGDQRRVTTPSQAVRAGADYLVIGRPVTASKDPRGALARILTEISEMQSNDVR